MSFLVPLHPVWSSVTDDAAGDAEPLHDEHDEHDEVVTRPERVLEAGVRVEPRPPRCFHASTSCRRGHGCAARPRLLVDGSTRWCAELSAPQPG